MANEKHLKILRKGVEVWNKWRKDNPDIIPDFRNANFEKENFTEPKFTFKDFEHIFGINFTNANLESANLKNANLTEAYLDNADLSRADLTDANLTNALLQNTNLGGAILKNANLQSASLILANLFSADLGEANLEGANLLGTIFCDNRIVETNFFNAVMGATKLVNVDLSLATGLEGVNHSGSSTIGIDTFYKSAGKIPESFLRGCGIPDDFITFIPSHFGIQQAIQFYSCFISYSTKDEEFARRLYSRMREEKLRVWFAPEDIKGGQKLYEQIEQAIQLHDRLLIILSEESMASEWVKREIRNARRAEVRENRRKLFPIRLVDYQAIENWKGFDGDGGEDLAFELGKFYIPDFSNWKDHDSFEKEFAKLLRDLKAEEVKQAEKRVY